MKVINLFGGPGSGKSTTAAELFSMMKHRGKRVELVTETAKDLTWENNVTLLEDSLWVLAEQNRRLHRLKHQVDIAITDSPLLLALAYGNQGLYKEPWFEHAVTSLFNHYDNANFFIIRQKPYEQFGRSQTEVEALDKDVLIKQMLHVYPHQFVTGDEEAAAEIYRSVFPCEDLEA